MIARIAFAVVMGGGALSGGDRTPETRCIAVDPIEVTLPCDLAAHWQDLSAGRPRAPVETPGVALVLPNDLPAREGRLDVFSRENGGWVWVGTYRFLGELDLPRLAGSRDLGVLLRFAGLPRYAWGEASGDGSGRPLRLGWLRNIAIQAPRHDVPVTLYVSGEDSARSARSSVGPARVARIPLGDGLACIFAGEYDACSAVEAEQTQVMIEAPSDAVHARVFKADPRLAPSAFAPGLSVIRPQQLPLAVVSGGEWRAVFLRVDASWDGFVIDWSGESLATTRVSGPDTVLPPAFSTIPRRADIGLRVRAGCGASTEPIAEREAQLLFFPAVDGPLGWIPITRAAGDAEGIFRAPALPSGTYRLKLLSAMAGPDIVRVSLLAGMTEAVRFESGHVVRGRVRLQSFEALPGLPEIQVVKAGPIHVAAAGTAVADPVDSLRGADVEADGRFRLSVSHPGIYRLRAIWGSARAERQFSIRNVSIGETDLGEITLTLGPSLTGTMASCAGGELEMMPVPDVSKPPSLEFFDLRLVPIGPDGRFRIESLTPGLWTFAARCGSKSVDVEPEFIALPETGETTVELSIHAEGQEAPRAQPSV
jgi:hypothetical protein